MFKCCGVGVLNENREESRGCFAEIFYMSRASVVEVTAEKNPA